MVYIESGVGTGQYRVVLSNTNNKLNLRTDRPWRVNPIKGASFRLSHEYKGDIDYLNGDGVDNDLDGISDEIGEGLQYFFTRIANVITFRSEIFDVIVRGRVTSSGRGEVASAQLRAVIDRSTSDSGSLSRPKVLSKRWE